MRMKVALTFDDGPNPPRTDQILQILESRGARGTFFVLGKWVERWPEAFMRIVSGGHTLANHSHLHQAHLGDFDHAEAVLGNLMGRPTRHLRAHYFNYFTCLVSPLAMSQVHAGRRFRREPGRLEQERPAGDHRCHTEPSLRWRRARSSTCTTAPRRKTTGCAWRGRCR